MIETRTGSRIGAADADVVLINKGGRDIRYDRLQHNAESPREFFYGLFDLEKSGISAAMISSSDRLPGLLGRITNALENLAAAATNLGARPLSARLRLVELGSAKVAISYTDGFSLSLGLARPYAANRPIVIGGFHGLSDIKARVANWAKPLAHMLIRRALSRLDHVFFFGPADREFAIENFGLARERSSVIRFGVDTDYWRPIDEAFAENFVVAVGQDLNRDYESLVRAPGRHRTIIVTRQKIDVPPEADHITITAGDYFGSDSMSDDDLRRLYNRASAVVVPLNDVYQPSGYSVTLQAMSCARPVILTKTRGLWAPDRFVDGENCLLVPPGDAGALGSAISRLRADKGFAGRLGRAGRETVMQHFNLAAIGESTLALARRGLGLWTSHAVSPLDAKKISKEIGA